MNKLRMRNPGELRCSLLKRLYNMTLLKQSPRKTVARLVLGKLVMVLRKLRLRLKSIHLLARMAKVRKTGVKKIHQSPVRLNQ